MTYIKFFYMAVGMLSAISFYTTQGYSYFLYILLLSVLVCIQEIIQYNLESVEYLFKQFLKLGYLHLDLSSFSYEEVTRELLKLDILLEKPDSDVLVFDHAFYFEYEDAFYCLYGDFYSSKLCIEKIINSTTIMELKVDKNKKIFESS